MNEFDRSEEMLKAVPQYYRGSKHYLAQNNAKGQEFNIMRAIIDDMPNQFNPQTATWGLKLWEEFLDINGNGDLLSRRCTVNAKLLSSVLITPISLERIIKKLYSANIVIVRNIKPYTFRVRLELFEELIDLSRFRNTIDEFKEAHMAYELLANYNSHIFITCLYKECLSIHSKVHPRMNIPYLRYNGRAKYNGRYRYNGYMSDKRIDLYPTRLNVSSGVEPFVDIKQKISFSDAGFKNKADYVIKYTAGSSFDTAPKYKMDMSLNSSIQAMPTYVTKLTTYYHITKYNGARKYNGKRKYDSKVTEEIL